MPSKRSKAAGRPVTVVLVTWVEGGASDHARTNYGSVYQ